MRRRYIELHAAHMAGAKPSGGPHEVDPLVEVGATTPLDADPGGDGAIPVQEGRTKTLGVLTVRREVLDGVLATSGARRRAMYERCEAADEAAGHVGRLSNHEVALPFDQVPDCSERSGAGRERIDLAARLPAASRLGEGDGYRTVCPTDPSRDVLMAEMDRDAVADPGGSFSTELASASPSAARSPAARIRSCST